MKITKAMIIIAVLLPAAVVWTGDLTVDNLTVSKDEVVYGTLNIQVAIASTNGGGATATGGAITTNGEYQIHTFTNSGTFAVSGGTLSCDVLVVAGGAGGALGGGGAGGTIWTNISVTGTITVTIGGGGNGSTYWGGDGANGTNTVFGVITAIGGGKGAHGDAGGNGGSGGGGGYVNGAGGTGTVGQGYNGGSGINAGDVKGGGGGGAGGPGGNAVGNVKGGDGGAGINLSSEFPLLGDSGWFGGGGGGVEMGSGSVGIGGNGGGGDGGKGGGGGGLAGMENTGGGGGGNYTDGKAGGSGIVIVRYQISSSSNVTILTVSSNGISQASTSGTNVFMSNVGIGTNNPAEKLHVAGNVQVDGTNIVSAIKLGGETRTTWPTGNLSSSNNLSDITDQAAARTNLGLGSAATYDAGAFLATNGNGAQLTNITAAQVGALSTNAGALLSANNLSDVANAGTARSNLGLGSAATNNASAFLSTTGGEVNGAISFVSPAGDIPMGVYTNQ